MGQAVHFAVQQHPDNALKQQIHVAAMHHKNTPAFGPEY